MFRRKKFDVRKGNELKVGDIVVYPTGEGEITSYADDKIIDAMCSTHLRYIKMTMLSGPHKGTKMSDTIPHQDTVQVYRKPGLPKEYTVLDVLGYSTACVLFGMLAEGAYSYVHALI